MMDLHRDLGRLEGGIVAANDRLDSIDRVLERIDLRLARIEATESTRKGAFSIGQWLVGVIGAGIALVVNHFWRVQ